MIAPSKAQERMGIMKIFWFCIWVAIAATEISLAAWFHSATFIEIGAVALLMVAFNLQRRVRIAARKLAEASA
jgi:hypothetical protein